MAQTQDVKVVINAQDNASSVFSKFSANIISLNQALEVGKKAFSAIAGTLNDFLDAQKSTDLMKKTVESMGVAFESVEPQISAFGERMFKLGIDNETAELAMAKLTKYAGGEFAQGMNLAKLAADLAASGIGTMEENVDNFEKILSGKGSRALMQYKLNIDENSTTAEIFNAIQGKVTQTVEQFADTIPGRIQTVTETYNDLREEVGGGDGCCLY